LSVAECLDPMTESDLDWVAAQEADLHDFPWTRGNFADSLHAGYDARVLRIDGAAVGYAIMFRVLDEAHLLNISVMRALHNHGIGARMLRRLMDIAREQGASQMFLEVRPSNLPALALYRRLGFVAVGRRKRYYPAVDGGREDALLMRTAL